MSEEPLGVPPPSVVAASGGLSWTRVRTPRVLANLGKAAFALSGVGGAVMALSMPLGIALAMLSAVAWPLFIVSYILSLTQTSFAGALEIHDDHLAIQASDKRKVIPRGAIRSAMVVERRVFEAFVPTVEIELVNGDILVARLPDPTAARAVVHALGFGPGGARVHASLAKPTRRLFHPLLGLGAYIFAAAALAVGLEVFAGSGSSPFFALSQAGYSITALGLYAVLKRLIRAPEITVGDDGVLLRTRRGQRFVPRRDIAFVSPVGSTIVVETREGVREIAGGVLADDARLAAIARVIEERAGVSTASADRFTHYDRAGRPLAEWRAHLGRAMSEASYRANAATVDEAAAVLRSPQATPEQRIGAALALRVAGQPKERIRVAVEASVDAPTREALSAIADSDDDAALEKALLRLPSPR